MLDKARQTAVCAWSLLLLHAFEHVACIVWLLPCLIARWDAWSCLETLKEVVDALIFLHENKILHGDLKAANVLLLSSDQDKRAFVAKVRERADAFDKSVTRTHKLWASTLQVADTYGIRGEDRVWLSALLITAQKIGQRMFYIQDCWMSMRVHLLG